MHHFFEAITNTAGDSLIGYFGRVINRTTQNTVTLSSDENGTPIVVTSGVENMAKTDDYGNLGLYVEPGTYHLDIYAPNTTTFLFRVPDVAMNSSKGDKGDAGDTGDVGASDATFSTLAALKAINPSVYPSPRLAASSGSDGGYVNGPFTYQTGNFTGRTDVVQVDGVPLTTGALVRTDVKALVFKAAFGASKFRPTDEKLGERVSVLDYMTEAMIADVKAGMLSVDCGPAFQAAFDACSGKGQSSLTTGRKLHIPAGRILIASKATWDWRSTEAVLDAGDRRKLTIEGDGAANTVIFSTVSGDYAFDIKGYATGGGAQDGTHLDLTIRGFTLTQRTNNRTGGGIKINNVSRLRMVDVNSQYFNIGAELYDCINVKLEFCDFSGNNLGIRGGNGGFSNPNLWRVANTSFGGCQIKGVEISRGANVTWDTCGFEGIGTSNDPGSGCYAAHLLGGPTEGGPSHTFFNCYFEGNFVAADIRVEWGDANNGTIKVDMCSFNRVSSTQYARRHILPSQVGAGRLNVLTDGNVYKHLGTYAGSEPPWEVPTSNVIMYARGEEYAETARPASNGFATVGLLLNVMSVAVAADGTYDSAAEHTNNVSSVTKTGTGAYRVFYKNNPRDFVNVHPNITLANSSGFGTYSTRASDHIDIVTLDAAGNSADKAFTLNVFGGF